jgi:uncharacterized protein
MTDAEIKDALQNMKEVAVVGISPDPSRTSHQIAKFLIQKGFNVIGVRPNTKEVLGRPCYSSLSEVPNQPQIINVFRASEHIPELVDEVIKAQPKIQTQLLWLQEGVTHPASEEKARKAGIQVISDRCILKEYYRLVR